jgi:GT2 family glycosyltransferase
MMRGKGKLPRAEPRFNNLPRRAYLTIKHHGWGAFLFRVLTSPLRLTGAERRLRERRIEGGKLRRVRRWYRKHWRPVTVIVPTYGPPDTTIEAVERLKKTLNPARARIVVVDDGSPAPHQEALRVLKGVTVIASERNAGFAASVNRGLDVTGDEDVVVLNNDVIAHEHWLEKLQDAAYADDAVGIVGPKLLYPDGRIQSAGSYRNLGAPEWFDHRYRFKAARHGPAEMRSPVLAVTGACMYVKRAVIDSVGPFDAEYPMGYEDVDYCLRAWEAGWQVKYEPFARLTHLESVTRGMEVGTRERESQRRFWSRWGDWFDRRPVRTPDGALRVIYVTEDTGVGGGHRDVFEHLNRLRERGHAVELFSLDGEPDWFSLRAPVRSFEDYDELADALASEDAIKVATWWATANPVWRASATRGVPLYFIQDIETSYYPGNEDYRNLVLATYREEFRYVTISAWNRARLGEMGFEAELVPPGVDRDTFRPVDVERRDDVVLAIGRKNPLKNLPLTVSAWKALEPRPELWMFGVEPDVGRKLRVRYFDSLGDAQVNELFNRAAVFVQTSIHEGFCLPLLEAMAAGTPVVTTDAHGNRDFCRDGENCLVADATPHAVAGAIGRLLRDDELRSRLVEGGLATVREYQWERRIDQLEVVLGRIADEAERGEASTAARAAAVGSAS